MHQVSDISSITSVRRFIGDRYGRLLGVGCSSKLAKWVSRSLGLSSLEFTQVLSLVAGHIKLLAGCGSSWLRKKVYVIRVMMILRSIQSYNQVVLVVHLERSIWIGSCSSFGQETFLSKHLIVVDRHEFQNHFCIHAELYRCRFNSTIGSRNWLESDSLWMTERVFVREREWCPLPKLVLVRIL